jgi:hypothetical protein
MPSRLLISTHEPWNGSHSEGPRGLVSSLSGICQRAMVYDQVSDGQSKAPGHWQRAPQEAGWPKPAPLISPPTGRRPPGVMPAPGHRGALRRGVLPARGPALSDLGPGRADSESGIREADAFFRSSKLGATAGSPGNMDAWHHGCMLASALSTTQDSFIPRQLHYGFLQR